MQRLLDTIAEILAIEGLKRNHQPLKFTSFLSVSLLFAPGIFFVGAIWLLKDIHPRFEWANDLSQYPWHFWGIAFFGLMATLGGVGDWIFHKIYTTVGPHEHHSHLLALGAGGLVFILMAVSSVVEHPQVWLLPLLIALLITVTLICYDEFAFHVRRCKPFETMLHRLLVFGNGIAFLIWVDWIFASGVGHASA
ncbi:MAG: hypothetical protein AAF702_45050 [Chloroflexota bacterium]